MYVCTSDPLADTNAITHIWCGRVNRVAGKALHDRRNKTDKFGNDYSWRRRMNKLELLLAYCKDNSRVCPIPTRWNELYDLMLTGKHHFGARQGPRRPLILAAWSEPAELKALRLEEQLKWADNNNNLDPVDLFLRGLAESEWFHLVD